MTSQNITVDMETIKLIAKASAEAAALEVAKELREDMRADFEAMERRLTEKLDGYFGKLEASEHVIQHDRIERLLDLVDRMGEGIFSNILKQLLWGLVVAGVGGWLLWQKITGGL
jgi:hypothetical protein